MNGVSPHVHVYERKTTIGDLFAVNAASVTYSVLDSTAFSAHNRYLVDRSTLSTLATRAEAAVLSRGPQPAPQSLVSMHLCAFIHLLFNHEDLRGAVSLEDAVATVHASRPLADELRQWQASDSVDLGEHY